MSRNHLDKKLYKLTFININMKKVLTFIILTLFLTSFIVAQPKITSYATEDNNGNEEKFCGTSTYGACEKHTDCIKAGCSSSVCQSTSEEDIITTCEYKECYNYQKYKMGCLCIENQCQWANIRKPLTPAQIQKIKQIKNRLKIQEGTCTDGCTCTGSVMKCPLEGGGRNMTIIAGKSGNIIVQIKKVNMSTNVTLYKSEEGKLYGVFKNNETKQIKVMPNMVKERVRERVERELEDEEIELDEDGIYKYRAIKRVKTFGFIRAKARIRAEINSETGELVKIRNSWWAFFASEEGELIVGAGCGTVAPDSRDECCINKGYDYWDEENLECEFSE